MASYVVELYVRATPSALEESADRARAAAEELAREGRRIRYVRSIFLPADETCFHLYEAACEGDVDEASARAGTAFAQIVAAVDGRDGS